MADKSFEQRVREELGSLKMRPDAEVWKQVETGLHKEKKRRWFIWLFLFGGLAAASLCGYLLYIGEHNKTPLESASATLKRENEGISPAEAANSTRPLGNAGERAAKYEEKKTNDQAPPSKVETKSNVQAEKTAVQPAPIPHPKANNATAKNNAAPASGRMVQQPVGKRLQTPVVGRVEGASSKQAVTPGKTGDVSAAASSDQTATVTSSSGQAENITAGNSTGNNDKDKTANSEAVDATPPPVSKTDSSSTVVSAFTVVKKKARTQWQFGFSGGIGKSGLRSNLISIPSFFEKSSFDPANYSQGGISGPGNVVPGNTASYVPPSFTDATGFFLGAHAFKPINKTFTIGITAGYTLFQSKTTVGRRIDSTLAFTNQNRANTNGYYFINGDSSSYINRYHFVNFGADLYTSFSLFKKIPLRWQVGLGMQYLVASNGLHYDPFYRRLYQNNDVFNRVQTYMSTGIDVGIGKNPFLYIGPHFSWQLGQLAENASGPNHLMMGSVQASFILQKNNRKKK